MMEETTQNAEHGWNEEAIEPTESLIRPMDRFAASETLWNYQQRLQKALLELNDRKEHVSDLTLTALACAAARSEFPADDDNVNFRRLYASFRSKCSYDQKTRKHHIKDSGILEYSASAARCLSFPKNTVDAALKCLEALIAADEPLTNFSDNLHPVQLAQRINRRGIELFRGRVIGLPE